MNKTMENAWRYLPKPCDNPSAHTDNGCYQCRVAYHSDVQGATAIAEALIAEGFPAFVEQTGGFNMVVYVYGHGNTSIGCTAESGVIFHPDVNSDEFFYLTGDDYIPSYEGCTSDSLQMIIDTVVANNWRLLSREEEEIYG